MSAQSGPKKTEGARGPITSWSGWDSRGKAQSGADPVAAFEKSDPIESRAERRYELLAVAARGFRPPQFLVSMDLGDDGQTETSLALIPGHSRFKETWSLLYRQIAETNHPKVTPYAIYLLGVNPPADATNEDLGTFNDFYTNVHLVEVVERHHALRAVRYELIEEVKPPSQGAPKFLAVYEVDETSASNRRHVGPPYSAGPEVWQGHKTPWRLWYRRLR
ncbi:MAG: hypothetical protein ACRDVC_03605 [Acidimicrobiales bacterium]